MKNIYRFLMFGVMAMVLTAVGATSLFAQDACTDVEAKQAVYKKFTENLSGKTIAQRKMAVEAGDEYVNKYGNCPEDKEIVAYINKYVPGIKKGITEDEDKNAVLQRYNRFNTAINSKNTADIFSVGKEILVKEPKMLDVMLVLATAGYDQAVAKPPVDSYNGDAITYAKKALQELESGTKSTTGDFGVLSYSYKNKENALGWMNYIVGYVDFYRLGKKEEGLAYLYKSAMVPGSSTTKSNPAVFQTFATNYRDEVVRLGEEIVVKLKANNNQANDETKALIALQKGYADRSADAYARAYNVADKSAAGKAYRDSLYASLKEIYNLRYEGKKTDVDAYATSVSTTPMPDPAATVTPIDEEPATTASESAMTEKKPATEAPKPASTMTKPPVKTPEMKKPPVTPMSSTTTTKDAAAKDEATKVTVTKSKTPEKKPAPKKKGTR